MAKKTKKKAKKKPKLKKDGTPKKVPRSGRPKGSVNRFEHPSMTLTNAVVDQLVEKVERGTFRRFAASELGITNTRLWKWIDAGKKQIEQVEEGDRVNLRIQGELVLKLNAAYARCHERLKQEVLEDRGLSPDHRKAKIWFLEKLFSKEYIGNPNKGFDDETGKEVPVATDGAALLADKLKTLLESSE